MQQNIILTNEAQKLFDKYLEELRIQLENADISPVEKDATIDDIRSQIIELSNFKEEIIGTDTLKHVISKIGTPKEIVSTLVNEINFMDNVESNSKMGFTKNIEFTAKQVVKMMNYLSTSILIITLIILVSSFFINELIILYFILNILYLILVIAISLTIQSLDHNQQLVNNKFILENIRPDYRFVLSIILITIINIELTILIGFDGILLFFTIFQISFGILYTKIMYENRSSYL